MDFLYRTAKITYSIIENDDVMRDGWHSTQVLWNALQAAYVGIPNAIYRATGEKAHEVDEAFSYPGKFTLDKVLRQDDALNSLADRSFSYILTEFEASLKSWWSNLRSNPKARPPRKTDRPRLLNFEIKRGAKAIAPWVYKLTVLRKKPGTNTHAVVKINVRPGLKMKQVKIIRLAENGQGYIIYRIQPSPQAKEGGVAGLDLGIVNLATLAFQNGDSIVISGKGLLSAQQWLQKKASHCKPKNWKKGKSESRQSKRNIAYRRKAGNISKLVVHNLTKFVIDECRKRNVTTLVIGDLTGIREDADHGKKGNQRLHSWPFAQISEKLKYKAEEHGIEVVQVNEAYTSKCCHICGERGTRSPRGMLTCHNCQKIIHSDVNGAFNILNKVSPAPAYAGVGVEADLPGLPSPVVGVEKHAESPKSQRIGKAQYSQIQPLFVAKFDLRNWSVVQRVCNEKLASQCDF